MDVSAVIAIVGGIALLVGILGGGIEAERIKVPMIPKLPRFISGLVGAILIITSVWLSSFPGQQIKTDPQALSTSTPPVVDANLPISPTDITPLPVSTINPSQIVFSLEEATVNSFYKIRQANFVFSDSKSLVVSGAFYEGVYLRERMPANFRVVVLFETGDVDSQFIMGLSDGVNWRPNYHFVMVPNYSALKKQVNAEENWDYYLTSTNQVVTEPNTAFEVEFERSDGNIKIFVNGEAIILFGDEQEEVSKYNYLYFTGDDQRQPYMIDKLIVEDLDH